MSDEVGALGWSGRILRGVRVLATTADMVVTVDPDKLARRREVHPQPCLDVDDLSMREAIPGLNGPPSPVTLTGVVFGQKASRLGQSLPLAFQWRGFAPTAVRYSRPSLDKDLPERAQRFGIGVIGQNGQGGWKLIHPAGPRTGPRRTTVDRLVEEKLYAFILQKDLLDELVGKS